MTIPSKIAPIVIGVRVAAALLVAILIFLLILLAPRSSHAQAAEEMSAAPSVSRDVLNRETPEGFVHGLLNAMASEDYARAALYLDLSAIPPSKRDIRGVELAAVLQQLLDKGGWVAFNNELLNI